MSTGNKKVYRKTKRASEKDKRMAQLEKEIARLESENSKLKRDGVGYEGRLAPFGGAPRFPADLPALNRELHPVANKRVTHKSTGDEYRDEVGSRSKAGSADEASRAKKLRGKLIKVAKKSAGKK